MQAYARTAVAAERALLNDELERFRNGYQGSCYACEPVGMLNQKLKAELAKRVAPVASEYDDPLDLLRAACEHLDVTDEESRTVWSRINDYLKPFEGIPIAPVASEQWRIELQKLVDQIEKFAEEHGEANFYTGDALKLLRAEPVAPVASEAWIQEALRLADKAIEAGFTQYHGAYTPKGYAAEHRAALEAHLRSKG